MSENNPITGYQEAKSNIKEIIDNRVKQALDEIREAYWTEVVNIDLKFEPHQTFGDKHARGIYVGCSVELPGEKDYV